MPPKKPPQTQPLTTTNAPRSVPKIKPSATLATLSKGIPPKLAPGSRNVPLKPKVPVPTPATSKSAEGGPVRPRLQTQLKKQQDLLDAQYEVYLQRVVMDQLAQDMQKLMMRSGTVGLGKQVAKTMGRCPLVKQRLINDACLHIYLHLKKVEEIRGSFENLLDFAGKETLEEIQCILTKKFDWLEVKGIEPGDELFNGREIEDLVTILQNHLAEIKEKEKVPGFCEAFSDALKQIKLRMESARSANDERIKTNLKVLEYVSIISSDQAVEELSSNELFDVDDLEALCKQAFDGKLDVGSSFLGSDLEEISDEHSSD